ncbi:MAG: hypothetical protein ABFE07_14635, partial [Armatimonadia bacterium]
MSSAQVLKGWEPPASLKLRRGQRLIIDHLNDSSSRARKTRQLIAVVPTGYGKTLSICCGYAALKSAGVVQ